MILKLSSALPVFLSLVAIPAFAAPGDLDTGFGTSGFVRVETGSSMVYTGLESSAALQSDGKLVITRTVSNGSNNDFITVRLNADGSFDDTFGTGGKIITIFGSDQDISESVVIQPDGRIIVGGSSNASGWRLALTRFLPDGTPDPSFGTGGKVLTTAAEGASSAKGMLLQADGKIVTAGSVPGDYNDFAVVRFNTDGSLDSSFGTNGRATTSIGTGLSNDWATCLALQPDGKIVAAGYSDGDFAVVRYLANGALDTSFGGNGKVVTDAGGGGFLESIAVQADGRIVVAGGGGGDDFGLVRFNANGTLDTSFSSDGKLAIPVGDDYSAAYSLRVQADGRLLVAGIAQKLISYGLGLEFLRDDFALIRLNANGTPDTSFGTGGQVIAPGGEIIAGDGAWDILPLGDGKIFLVGNTSTGIAVARFFGDPPPPALAPPALTAPGTKAAPGLVLTTLAPTFAWKSVKNASGYTLALIDARTGEEVYANAAAGTATTHALPENVLLPGFRYAWTMRTKNGATLGTASAPLYFTVAENVPLPVNPVPASPGAATRPGKEVASPDLTFTWRAAAGAQAHGLYITDRASSQVAYQVETLPGDAIKHSPPPGTLAVGKAYEWRLRARNSGGWGAYSAPFYFSVKAGTLPTPPVLVEPGATQGPGPILAAGQLTPNFKWKAVPAATGYGLYIADVGTNQLIYDEEDIPAGAISHVLPSGVLQSGRAYRWNMRARFSDVWSGFAPRRFFQTGIDLATPVITGFDRSVLVGSNTQQPLIIEGSGFLAGAQVLLSWTGKNDYVVPAAQTFLEDDSHIRILITTTMTADTWTAKVRNKDRKTSNSAAFQVVAPSGSVNVPLLSPPGGTFTQPRSVTLRTFTPPGSGEFSEVIQPQAFSLTASAGSSIRYTLDGQEPTLLSPLYTGAFLLGGSPTITVKAKAFDTGAKPPSATATATFKFNLPTAVIPSTSAPFALGVEERRCFRVTVPAGLAVLQVNLSAVGGNCDLYLGHDGDFSQRRAAGRDVLPTITDYAFSSRAAGAAESLTISHPKAGVWHVLVHGVTACQDVTLTLGKTPATGAAPAPVFNPPPPAKGSHSAPIASLKIISTDPAAQIYYTLDGSEPSRLSASSRLYTTPLSVAATTTLKARAFVDGKNPSPVATGLYTIGEGIVPLEFTTRTETVEDDRYPYSYAYTRATLELAPLCGTSEYIDVPFHIDIPEDPRPVMSTSSVTYPVALLVQPVLGAAWAEFFLRRDQPVSGSTYDYSFKNLPDHAGAMWDKHYVLGTRVGKSNNIGDWLQPGRRYYGIMRCWGQAVPAASLLNITAYQTQRVQLRFEIHSATLDKPAGAITPNLANTWVLSHGKNSSPGRFSEMADALLDPALSGKVGQVLRLDWSSLARGGGGSLDEAMFTPGVGKRTHDVLKAWGISKDKVSLIGHSWGSYVSYQLAMETYTSDSARGKVKRLIALDPATAGTGGYWDSKVSFATYADRSWAFVAAGPFGSETYAITAAEAFRLGHTSSLSWLDAHSAPVELFTHFLRCNYSSFSSYAYDEDEISPSFSLDALDSQPGTLWKKNPMWIYDTGTSVYYDVDGFEAHLFGQLDDHSFDPSKGLHMTFQERAGNEQVTIPEP